MANMISPVKVWRERRQRYCYLGKVGRIKSFTQVMGGPEGFTKIPYWVGVIDLDKGESATGQLVEFDEKELKRGLKVKGVLRRLGVADKDGVIEYGVKFAPIGRIANSE